MNLKKLAFKQRESNGNGNGDLPKILNEAICLLIPIILFFVMMTLYLGLKDDYTGVGEEDVSEEGEGKRIVITVIHIPTKYQEQTTEKEAHPPAYKSHTSDELIEVKSNPLNLSPAQIFQQLKSAQIPSLKSRVKRFACWHSCFGQFRRKTLRKTMTNSAVTNVTIIRPTVPSEKQQLLKNNASGISNNDLGDGGVGPKRRKKSPTVLDYFKLKTKEKEQATRLAKAKKEALATTVSPPKKIESTTSHWDKERSNEGGQEAPVSADAKAKAKVQTRKEKVQVVEKDKEESEEENEESGSLSSEKTAEDGEDEASSSEEVEWKDGGDGVDKDDLGKGK